jgi:hypothetical protein
MVKSNWHEAHYRIFCISLFLPPSHSKYYPHHPALTNHQSVFLWHKTPNFTHKQNDRNIVSFTAQYRPHSELNGSKYSLRLSCSFFENHGPSQVMWHKILTALSLYHKDCSKFILHSPTISWILITRKARNSEYLLNVKNKQQKDKPNSGSSLLEICHWLLKILAYISALWHLKL